jgi:hypothetical protein
MLMATFLHDNGNFLGAHARWYVQYSVTRPLVVELAIACMEGLEFALGQGYSGIVLETDSQELLNPCCGFQLRRDTVTLLRSVPCVWSGEPPSFIVL